VNNLVNVPLTQGQFDALVDFVYNLGVGNFESSTLLRDLNAGDMDAAANEFDKWDHVSGQVVAGLLRRREAETKEFQA
jgi:lysozyme